MKLRTLLIILIGSTLMNSCQQFKAVEPSLGDETYQSEELMTLPGADRSQLDGLEPQADNYQCRTDSSGPYYRQQSSIAKHGNVNYMSGTITLGRPVYIGQSGSGNRMVSTAYAGGETQANGGALDVGFAADNRFGGVYWRAFIKSSPTSFEPQLETDKAASETKLYRIKGGKVIDFIWYIDENNKFNFEVKGVMSEFDNINDTTPNDVNITRKIVRGSLPGTWSYTGAKQFFKLMTSVALDRPEDFSQDGVMEFPASSWTNIKIGLRDKTGRLTNIRNWGDVLFDAGCPTPSDMVTPVANRSATIKPRVRSKINISPLPIAPVKGDLGTVLSQSITLKNVGPAGSYLYYDRLFLASRELG